jgi:protein-disulfide isomerase
MQFKQRFSSVVISLTLGGLVSCNSGGGKTSPNAEGIVRPLADEAVILEYNGGKITGKDVKEFVGRDIQKMRDEAVEAYQQAARQTVIQKLIEAKAAEKKQTVQEFMSLLPGAQPVTEAEIDAFFKAQPDLKKGVKDPRTGQIQKVSREDVSRFLEAQSRRSTQQKFVESLMAEASIKMKLELPPPAPIKVASSSKPAAFGSPSAKVVIHEFSDFQCPFCSRAKGIVSQLKEAYGDKIRIEFRHFPLDNHPEALPASIATVCANEQGKFWELHDKIFDNQRELNGENLSKWAKDVGLDMDKFKSCTSGSEAQKIVTSDMEEGRKAGVGSTPTFIVNGRLIAGAQPFDQFKSIIDAELSKK